MSSRLPALWLVASLCVPVSAAGDGHYGPLPIDEDEQYLIEQSDDLESYFSAHAVLYQDERALALVRRIGHELRPQPTDDYIEYEFFILRDPSPNAFALPNGHVYVATGMLARLQDEAQLAGVLAHEINHVAGHHTIVDHRATRKKVIAGLVLGGIGGWGSVISIGLQASIYGFGRDLEQEADDRAVATIRASRYDPHALPEVFDMLGRDYEGLDQRIPTIWSTHPEIKARAETSRSLVADLPRRERQIDEFEGAVFNLRAITIQDYIQDDYAQTGLALAEALVERYPNDPRLLHLLGDAWQGMGAQRRLDVAELSNSDKGKIRRDRVRKTRAERLAQRLETEEGRAAYASNLANAEATYRKVLALDPTFAAAHRGLGEVYEQQDKAREAAEAYLTYVRAAPEAPDRAIVVGRLRALTAKLKGANSDGN